MIDALAIAERQHKLLRYHAEAKRYLYERDRLRDASQEELQSLAESFMFDDFKRQIEPYERIRSKLLSDFHMLQVNIQAQMPKELAESLEQLNDLIATKARDFGYLDLNSRLQHP